MVNIQDSKTKAGLPGVTVAVFDSSANIIKKLYTNQYGELDTSYFLYTLGPSFVGVDFDGYADATFSVAYILAGNTIYLKKLQAGQTVPAVPANLPVAEKIAADEAANNAVKYLAFAKLGLIGIGVLAAGYYLDKSQGKQKVKGFDTLPPLAKNVLVIGGVAAAAYFLFISPDKSQQQLVDAAGTGLNDLAQQGITPTISNAVAESYASSLTAAFDGCGTDEDAILNVFSQLRNDADVYKLISVYGIRSYQGCFEGSIFTEDVTGNLPKALYSELSAGYIADINNILSSHGISYQF